jgi:hypothetical protein
MSERRFSDRDMNAIIQRAAALQQEASSDKASGPTLDQIQQAASELGISPEMVARAADEISSSPPDVGLSRFGSPTAAVYSRSAEGVLQEHELPGLLKEIRRLTGRVGYPRSMGDSFEWQSNQPDGLHISLTPRNGKTLIDVRASFGNWVGACIGLSVFCSLAIGLPSIGELGLDIGGALTVGLLLASAMANRSIFSRISRAKQKTALDLAVELGKYIEQETQVARQTATVESTSTTKIHQTLIG